MIHALLLATTLAAQAPSQAVTDDNAPRTGGAPHGAEASLRMNTEGQLAAKKQAQQKKRAVKFGPFDSGDPRDVTRQGSKGKARRAHPAVGADDKVPGEGPGAPPLSLDPYLPETVLEPSVGGGPNVVGASLSANPLFLASLLYANLLTKVDGPRCQHLPTCSRFASQAVARHGALGVVMGLDRVLQPPQSSAIRMLPDVPYHDAVRHYDPLENYEFWKSELFTGFPAPTPEQPLVLPALSVALADATTETAE